jgi:hypothetical protein
MGLRDDIMRENTKPRYECAVCYCIADMSKDDAAELVACLADSTIAATAIARALGERGYQINAEGKQIRRHRRTCV